MTKSLNVFLVGDYLLSDLLIFQQLLNFLKTTDILSHFTQTGPVSASSELALNTWFFFKYMETPTL